MTSWCDLHTERGSLAASGAIALLMSQDHNTSQRTALVLFGSETGNAQDVAEELGRLLRRLRFAVRVTELNAISIVSVLYSRTQLLCG